MFQKKWARAALSIVPLALVAAACGGGEDSPVAEVTGTTAPAATAAPATTAAPPTTAAPATTEAPPTTESGAISSFQDVQPAIIQIEARGTFRDPEVGFSDGSGRGSGFIISEDGLAVTNNHVVTGAATLEVFVGGDTSDSYNATVVGVSECNDLALIDINAPEPLPALEWYNDEITAGTDVYAAGFPLGDPEFTLTRGIVAKAEAGGDLTGTSSIDHTIEHDAAIQPGNSGGPLVTSDGTVLGVNYAGGATATTTAQFYAIASDLAQPVIERLMEGDFESLGINGWAVYDEGLGIAGIWVAGVAPGSPAADADILPGDIVTAMNGLPVGTDGTFKDYCDVIRTAGEGNPIEVEVLRFDTEEILRGEINGDQPIETTFSFADEVEGEVATEETTPGATPAEYTYESVVDETGQLTVEVPVEWPDRDLAPATLEDGTSVPYIAASPNRDAFLNGWDQPGLLLVALPRTDDIDGSLAQYGFGTDCTDGGITDYEDPVFTGKYQVWNDCGGTTTDIVTLVANDAAGPYTVVMLAQILTEADLGALDRAFATFNFVSS
jgi:serine protease Do